MPKRDNDLDTRINVRLTHAERETLRKASKNADTTMSEFVRSTSLKIANSQLKKQDEADHKKGADE